MTTGLFLVILAILAVFLVMGAWLVVRLGWLSSREALVSLVALSVLLFILLLLWLVASDSNGDQGQGHCQVEIHISGGAGEPRLPSQHQPGGTTGEEKLGSDQQNQPGFAIRQKCVQGSAKAGSLQLSVTSLTCAFVLLIGLLTHVTATGERAGTRARLVPDLPDFNRRVVRLLNIGGSPGFVIGVGTAPAATKLDRAKLPRCRWPEVDPVARLIPPGEENGVEIPLDFLLPPDGDPVAILIRYRDAYKDTWEAWRIVSISPYSTVVVQEDGERRSRG